MALLQRKKQKQKTAVRSASHSRVKTTERASSARTNRQPPEAKIVQGAFDLPYFALILLLTGIGLIMVLSASFPSAVSEGVSPFFYFKKQSYFAIIGLCMMLVVSRISYQRLRGLSMLSLAIATILLLLVLTPLGITRNNATRWLGFGSFTFQPSEIAKLAVILYFSDTISKKKERMETIREGILPYMGILMVFSLLLLKEPHLSGTVLILSIGATLMIVGGISRKLVLVALVGGMTAVFGYIRLVSAGILHYGASRINTWHDPFNSEWFRDSGWQLGQSQLAIGSGGLLGVGLGKSRQKFLYLPEEHNDFIFAVICEELGYLGACLIIILFMALILRGYWIALQAKDRFGALLVVGVNTHFALQTFLNISVVTGFVPTTGISLPLFSYGGTALVIQLVELGVVLNVSRQMRVQKVG